MSETIRGVEFNKKLVSIQQKLKAPKDEFNDFAKFKYRSAEAIVEAVKPLLHAEGLSLIITDEVVNIGSANYVKAKAIVTDGESTLHAEAYAREEVAKKGMDTAQITGSTSSYARKYALNGLFAIDDTKDADSHDNSNHTSVSPTAKVNVDQIKNLFNIAKERSGLSEKDAVLEWFYDSVGTKLNEVKQVEYDKVIVFLKEEA